MEALLAMMVVTVAVALLALSFSLTAHDLKGETDATDLKGCTASLLKQFREDVSLWRDDALVWTSLESRVATPYQSPNGSHAYSIQVIDLGWDVQIIIGSTDRLALGEGSRVVEEHAWNVIRQDGTIGPGLIVLEVW